MAKKAKATKGARTPGDVLKGTWSAAVDALTSAEREVERQIRLLLKKNKITAKDASGILKQIRARVEQEPKKAVKELQGRIKGLQARIGREGKAIGKMVESAVQGALAAVNIPTRREVAELTRKVEELSRKIDTLKRR